MTPRSRHVVANRLRHHLVEWGDRGPLLLLLHGFLEHAHAWDLVAPRLAAGGYHVFALDWRGHGDSEWIGSGGYYHFVDYSADLAFVIRALGGRAALVGHSMGATTAMSYAGLEPDRVAALVLVDALGPPDMEDQAVPERAESWIRNLERLEERDRRPFTLDEAAARLAERFPRFSPAVAHHMAEHGSRTTAGGREWKFDPLHQTTGPNPFSRARAHLFWRRVACPVLYIEGADSPLRLQPDDIADRLATLRASRITMPGAAHHPHLEQPEPFARIVLDFLGGLPCADS
ncbi:MAG TPA: alpha/beta hydrolase [Candidatus Binatia bacterium]|nr:alpha/beta hydrolase [Candidatus Binatia bacterium]